MSAPIVGTTSTERLLDVIGKLASLSLHAKVNPDHYFAGALDVKLSDEEISYLKEAYRPLPIIGHI